MMTPLLSVVENAVRRYPEHWHDPGYVGSNAPAR